MKKIICILTALVMLVACFAVCASAGADPKRAATVIAADESGYGIWSADHKTITLHLANDSVLNRVKNMCTFAGFVVSVTSQDTGIIDFSNGTCYQYGGGEFSNWNDSARTASFKINPQDLADVYSGANEDTGKAFPEIIETMGGVYAVRVDTNNTEGNDYLGYCFPVYEDKKPDGLYMTSAKFNAQGGIEVRFNSEVDNVWDLENADGSRDGSVYEGCGRFCAIRIVDNTTNWNLMWDGDKPAQWEAAIMDVGSLGWPFGYKTNPVNYGGHLGCNSFEDICNLVKPGGKFEGCVVTYCIEELIGSNGHSAQAVGGDGYINSFFANGGYNDIKYVLKANKPAADGVLDGAYVVMYDPNPKTADMTGVAVACAVLSAAAAAVVFARKKH